MIDTRQKIKITTDTSFLFIRITPNLSVIINQPPELHADSVDRIFNYERGMAFYYKDKIIFITIKYFKNS